MRHIAIFPGAFKPPTKGHFQAVLDLANNKFKIANYDVEEVPATGNRTKKVATNITGKSPDFKIDEVLVLYGTQERNGITPETSAAIWEIYKKHLPANVKIAPANGNPTEVAKDIIEADPSNQYHIPVGLRRPEDLKDLGRLNMYKNLPNAKGIAVYGVPEEGQDLISATHLRSALLAGDDEEAKKYLPSQLTPKELSKVIDLIKSTVTIEEKMNYAMEQVMLGMLTEEKEVEEVTMGLPVAPMAVLPSEVTQYMRDLTAKLKPTLPKDVTIEYNGQAIMITPKYYNKPNADDNTPEQDPINEYEDHIAAVNYVPYIASILEHMVRKGMTVLPLPEIVTREDEENAANVFGSTAKYNPTEKKVVLYVTGRHPKDVLRSFCHEMIHHMQNLEGRLPAFTTTNTQEDSALNEIEKEAHYLGSMTMREWEDSMKNEYNNPQDGKAAPYGSGYNPVKEGTKYRSIVVDVRKAVNDALNTLLSGKKLKGYNLPIKREPSKKDIEFAEKYGMSPLGAMLFNEYQTAYLGTFESKSEKGTPTTVGVSLKFALTDEVKPGKFHIDGEASSDEAELDIILAFNPADSTNMLQQIQPVLTDLIRHETEHLTQSGDQVKPTKWMRGDQARRREIRQNPEIWHKYYMLPKEVDANIQGLYAKSKYEKKDFQTVVDAYLDDLVNTEIITVGNRQKIYDLWKQRIPQIGGIPNLK